MEMSETWSSFGRRIAITIVSVRYAEPGRLSEPISRKVITAGPSYTTAGGGGGAGGGRAARGWGGAPPATSVGRTMGGRGVVYISTEMVGKGVASAGWKGVGEGDARPAGVTMINGSPYTGGGGGCRFGHEGWR